MKSYEVITFIICMASSFSYINYRFIKWPSTIGIMALSLMFSVLLVLAGSIFPALSLPVINAITSINFNELLMKGMLSFLLFAGAIHIDAQKLKKVRLPVITLATVGILISTFLIGTFLYFLFYHFPPANCIHILPAVCGAHFSNRSYCCARDIKTIRTI